MACDKTGIDVSKGLQESQDKLTRLNWGQNRGNTGKLGIEVAGIRWVLDRRHERRLHPLVVDVVPVDVTEERLAHHLLCISWAASESLIWLTSEQLLKNGDGVPRHVDRVQRLISKDSVVDFVLILASEGGLLKKHLVDQDTKRPPIDGASVLLVKQNLVQS